MTEEKIKRLCPEFAEGIPYWFEKPRFFEIEKSLVEALAEARKELERYTVAVPISDWHEDTGRNKLWWKFPVQEPPYSGSPLDTNWPEYHTHFTDIPLVPPPQAGEASEPHA